MNLFIWLWDQRKCDIAGEAGAGHNLSAILVRELTSASLPVIASPGGIKESIEPFNASLALSLSLHNWIQLK